MTHEGEHINNNTYAFEQLSLSERFWIMINHRDFRSISLLLKENPGPWREEAINELVSTYAEAIEGCWRRFGAHSDCLNVLAEFFVCIDYYENCENNILNVTQLIVEAQGNGFVRAQSWLDKLQAAYPKLLTEEAIANLASGVVL